MPHTPSLTVAPSLVTPPPPGQKVGGVRRPRIKDVFTLMRQGERIAGGRDLLAEFRRRIRRRRGFLSTILTGPLGATESPEGIRRTLLGGGET